ncbi:MAG: GNAT family N-acetyltransferase [Pirellulaceae bacterium]
MPHPQLKMNWPVAKLSEPPVVNLAAGYSLRACEPYDEEAFVDLMHHCGWNDWDDRLLDYCKSRLLPGGWFAVIENKSDTLVASAMSLHNYTGRLAYSGTLGWVGCVTEHRRHGLGTAVVAAATSRLIDAGYRDIELYTEHFRTAALRSYLRLGYVPDLYNDQVTALWKQLCRDFDWPFSPELWPTGKDAFPNQ